MRTTTSAGVRARARHIAGGALFAGAAGLALAPAPATAQDATTVDEVTVEGAQDEPGSPKYVAPLLDTPQTITVIPNEVIEAQNLLTLRDVLSTVPGITFGAGEGGGGYGDSINLRGYSANNDIAVDGLRDTAQYTRSDPFNLEQVEVANGASSVYSGSGSVGGSINLVTKSPTARDFTAISLGGGTDSYARATLDMNRVLGSAALRLNLMAHENDVPGRDVESYSRWGIAPSLTLGVDGMTQATFSYFHQSDDNTPQYGVPYASNAFLNGPLPGVDPADYFGYRNIDSQEIDVDAFTVELNHEFSPNLRLRSIARYQQTDQLTVVNPPQGTFCLASGLDASDGSACAPAGSYQPSGPRGTLRDTRNTQLIAQTDLTWEFRTGGAHHTLNAGVSASSEDFHLDSGNVQRNPLGATPNPSLPLMDLSNPDSIYTGPVNPILNRRDDGELDNQAIYVFDAIELSPRWELNGGARLEHTEGMLVRTDIDTPYPTPPAGPVETARTPTRNEADLFSYRLGVVFKPIPEASIYAALGNSQTPSQESVRQGCSDGSGRGGPNCNVDPQEAQNIEIGAKWAAMDGRLSLTAAAFRNEQTNYLVDSADPLDPTEVLDGEARVDGVALSAAGEVRPGWSVFFNYTYLDSEVVRGKAIECITDPANAVDCPTPGIDDPTGRELENTPRHSASLWSTWVLPRGFTLGYGLTYSGSYLLNNGIPELPRAPSHTVHRLMVSYAVTDHADLQFNINNVTDEEYYSRIRSARSGFGWATPGDGRNANLTLNYRF